MFVGKHEHYRVIPYLVAGDRVLGNHAIFVFDFHGHGVVGQDGFCLFENGGHFASFDPMIIVFAYPNLELTGRVFTKGSAAIQEGFF